MKKLMRLLAVTSLITIGSASALFTQSPCESCGCAHGCESESVLKNNQFSPGQVSEGADQVDIFHQELIGNIQKSKQLLVNLSAKQASQHAVQSAVTHLDKALDHATKANSVHHNKAGLRVAHVNNEVDEHHKRLMAELKKADQHVHALGYVSMKKRSEMAQMIEAAEAAAVAANRAHHEAMPND